MARLSWMILVAAVSSGVTGLAVAVLRLYGVIETTWTLVLLPIWLAFLISGALAAMLLLHTMLERAQRLLESLFASYLAVR